MFVLPSIQNYMLATTEPETCRLTSRSRRKKWQSVLVFVLFPTLFAALVNKIYRLFLLTGPYQFYWAKPRLFYFSSDCVVGKIEPTSSWPNKTDTGLLAKIDGIFYLPTLQKSVGDNTNTSADCHFFPSAIVTSDYTFQAVQLWLTCKFV